ncbi:MAG: ABC transporter substrate-binding protein, partial [Mycetocola sp.]
MRKYLAVLAVSAVALSGCAGSDSGGESDVSGPIKLFQIGPVQSQAVSLPGLQYSAEAEVAEINEAGGVNGRKLELTTCNDKYDPNESLRCAQRAVREGAVAMVGTLTTYENSLNPVFEKAGLANVAPDAITAAGAKSDTTFLLDAGVPGYAAFPIVAKEKLGAAKIAAVHFENPSIDSTQKFFEDGAELAGIDVVAKIVIPADAIDFAQYVAQAERAGAEAFVSAMGP